MANSKTFKEKLEKEGKAIEIEIKSLGQPRDFGSGSDKAEETEETEEFDNQLALQQVLKNKLADINYTLQKIEQNRYGVCENCGQKISWLVLKIAPTSRLCRKCKKLLRK
jgi:RNA polymerase-binding transcription factor DksA